MTSNLTEDSGIHTMSSKKDSVFYDSSSFPYANMGRKANSDCFPYHTHYQPCSGTDQLKVKSCDILPRHIESQKTAKDSDFYHKINSLENHKQSCCDENSGLNYYGRNMQVPSDPGGGKYFCTHNFML